MKGGQLDWRYQTNGPVLSSPAVAGRHVYVTSHDGFLYALKEDKDGRLVMVSPVTGVGNGSMIK